MAAAVALGVPALAPAAVVPDVSDLPAGAQQIELLPGSASELIERPGDQDWYSILGRRPDDPVNAVFVRVLQSTATCTSPQLLRVALFNPEGRWMRTTTAGVGNVATVLVPALPSRYSIDVSAIDAGCSGLEYEVTSVSTDPPTPDSAASHCLVARARVMDTADHLKVLEQRRPGYTPAAQTRYDGYIAAARDAVAKARKTQKRLCK